MYTRTGIPAIEAPGRRMHQIRRSNRAADLHSSIAYITYTAFCHCWDRRERTAEQQLIGKLQRIVGPFAGATTPGERLAAENALKRIQQRVEDLRQIDPPIEYKFRFENMWSKRLFVALLRRYCIQPFRYYRRRYTTVMAEVPR